MAARLRRPRHHASVRRLVALAVVLPIVAVSLVLVGLLVRSSNHISEDLASTLATSAAQRVRADVHAYLASAVRVSDLYERRLAGGVLSTRELSGWERYMLDDLATTPTVASICFANPGGDTTWLLRAHGRLELRRVSGARIDAAQEFEVDQAGRIEPEPIRTYRYDPRERPWYQAALAADGPVWTPVYFWFPDQGSDWVTGAGYSRAIRDPDGRLLGVLVIDVTLGALSQFIQTMPLAQSGWVFLLDDQDRLVASSQGHVNSPSGERLSLASSPAPVARAVHRAVAGEQEAFPARGMWRVHLGEQAARVDCVPLDAQPGLAWRVVTVVPESLFLADARQMQRRAILLSILAVVASLLIGLALAHWLTRPLLQLAGHIRRVGAGDFESRLELHAARELQELSEELNRMAAGLKERMQLQQDVAVATHVQQSLLPQVMPLVPGLELAGRSRYCDATGGDYFDFVEVTGLPRQQTLVAVGDVMGHGIGAALLMATARAALRAAAEQTADLGELMTAVNHVLTRDARHRRFMTMVLMVVEPQARCVRWARAGHDPVLVYEPAGDTFAELDDGDVVLGVDESVAYQEFRREDLTVGSVLVVGTDGIWEARNEPGEMYGKDRLRDVIRSNSAGGAARVAAAIEDSLRHHLGDRPLQDDVTFVVVKLCPALVPAAV